MPLVPGLPCRLTFDSDVCLSWLDVTTGARESFIRRRMDSSSAWVLAYSSARWISIEMACLSSLESKVYSLFRILSSFSFSYSSSCFFFLRLSLLLIFFSVIQTQWVTSLKLYLLVFLLVTAFRSSGMHESIFLASSSISLESSLFRFSKWSSKGS